MEDQGLVKFFHDHLHLPVKNNMASLQSSLAWKRLCRKINDVVKEVKIALVGKYTKLEDAYASVIKALQHASWMCNLKLNLKVHFQNS